MFRTHFSQIIKSWPFPPRSSVSQRLCLFTCACCALKPTNGRDYNEEMMMMMMTPPDMSNPIRTATETQHLGTFSFRFGLGCQWPVEIYGFSTHDDDMVQLDGVLPVSNSQPARTWRRHAERTGTDLNYVSIVFTSRSSAETEAERQGWWKAHNGSGEL